MLYFLYGNSSSLLIKYEEILNKIKNENFKIPIKYYDMSSDSVEEFLDSLMNTSIFSPKEAIVLKRAENIRGLEKFIKQLKNFNYSEKEIIIIYELFNNEFGKAKNPLSKSIVKEIEEVGKFIEIKVENEYKSAIFMIMEELNISEYEADILLKSIGNDFFKIKNEIEKIKNFLEDERYSFEKVKPILSMAKEGNLSNLIDNFIKTRETKELIELISSENLYQLFIYSFFEELNIYIKILNLLNMRVFEKKISYKKFNEEIFEEIKKYFSFNGKTPHPYTIFLKIQVATLFNIEFLKDKIQELLYIDYNYKSGNSSIEIDIELFIYNFFRFIG